MNMLDLVYAGRHPQKPHIILCHIGGNDMFDEREHILWKNAARILGIMK